MTAQDKNIFPYIPKHVLWEKVEGIRKKYWLKNNLPVDVELIVEKLGFEIIPTTALTDVEAFLNIKATSI
jgi:hypothetical protein